MVPKLAVKIKQICTSLLLIALIGSINPIDSGAVTISWNTFLGGSGGDGADDVTLDTSKNIYITAYCDADWGTPILPYSGGADLSVSKLTPDGTLIWHTFLGGTGTDYSTGIAYSNFDNHIYITGMCNASWGTPLQAYGGNFDAFVAKLDLNGNLIWHTFIGGPGRDRGRGLDIDPSTGDIFITGDSDTTWGTPVQPFTTGVNIFIARLNNSGSLIWSTFTAGNGADNSVGGISLDGSANSHIIGFSNGTWGTPVRAYSGSAYDAYAAKIDHNGFYVWNTFLGGPGPGAGNDYGTTLKTDSAGNVYALGTSGATWGTPIEGHHGGLDGFIAKLNPAGALQWHTFIGGTGSDDVDGMIYEEGEPAIYLEGKSTADWGVPDRAYTAGEDILVIKLTSAGIYNWHMFLGGSGDDFGTGIALDGLGHVIVTGSSSATWGTPLNAFVSGTDCSIVTINESFLTATVTETCTITPTATPTATITFSPSFTPSPTATPTFTPSVTETPIGSPTLTPSPTGTVTASPIDTGTATLTSTPSPTLTVSPTQTMVFSPIPTLTSSVTPIPSHTSVPAPSQTLANVHVYPNPCALSKPQLNVYYCLYENASVKISIYNYLGDILLRHDCGEQIGQAFGQQYQWAFDCRDSQGNRLRPGGYILYIDTRTKDGRCERASTKLAIIR